MIYINAFLFCGLICLLGELILDNTNLTPASVPITSFGNLLYQACLEGYKTKGVLGMFTNLLTTTSGGISGAIIFAFITTLFCKSKD